MCSVVGCDSWRRSAQRFKLPADPENRLEWVQFLAEVNGQGFKESSWTDITICREHFTSGCFENPNGTYRLKPGFVRVRLKPGAVPSLCLKSEPDEDDLSPSCEPAETTAIITYDSPTYYSEESSTSVAAEGSPAPSGDSCSADTSDAFTCDYGQMLQNIENIDIIREKAARLHMKGKYVVNEKQLLKLFSCKCPSCGSKVKVEKFTHGILLILNQQCLQCEYKNQWKSQAKASVPTADLTGGVDVTPETRQEESTDDNHGSNTGVPEIFAIVDEQSDAMDDTDSSDPGDMGSDDEEWNPVEEIFADKVLRSESDEETEYEEDDDCIGTKNSQLCTECGMFFNKWKPHTCVHKVKPYSCNICGKRCVSEIALNAHNRVHDDNYEHRCKYCHVTFNRKVDKMTHEQIHLTQGKPYKCQDCAETFATNKERRIHLKSHRGPRQLKCDICGIQFNRIRSLRRHVLVHTGVKPHKCSVCQRGFNQASHLKSHMRMHTGEKPFKCQHCDKCFNHNVSLKNHVQRYHTSADGQKRGTDSGLDDVEIPIKKKRNITRPIGRPKRNAAGKSLLAGQTEDQGSKTKTSKVKGQRSKKACYSDEESEDKPTDSELSCDSTVEQEELKTKSYGIHNTGRATWKRRWKVKN